MPPINRRKQGKAGEYLAALYLEKNGLKINRTQLPLRTRRNRHNY